MNTFKQDLYEALEFAMYVLYLTVLSFLFALVLWQNASFEAYFWLPLFVGVCVPTLHWMKNRIIKYLSINPKESEQ